MRFIIALRDSLGNCRQRDLAASCAALPCMVPARPMSTPPPAGSAGPAAPPQQATSPLTIHGQYIKDLSFENPRAPQSLIEQKQPQLTLNVNVATRQFETKTFEVTLTVEATAQTPEKEPLFVLELVYAGTVTLGDVPQDAYGPLLLIETPRLLFPFARAIVANATRVAGFDRIAVTGPRPQLDPAQALRGGIAGEPGKREPRIVG